MHRFFLPINAFQDDTVDFTPDISRQINRVLRLQPPEKVIALDNSGWQYLLELTDVRPELVRGKILEKSTAGGEAPVVLNMCLCLAQREKFEWMLQKCTEVGAASFTPVISSRSLVQDQKNLENKRDRWQRILQEAAEQSRRGRIPSLNQPLDYSEVIRQASSANHMKILAWEAEKSLRLQDALMGLSTGAEISLLIGPEGGISADEAEMAAGNDWKLVSLGPRILRMETAAVVAAALVIDKFESDRS